MKLQNIIPTANHGETTRYVVVLTEYEMRHVTGQATTRNVNFRRDQKTVDACQLSALAEGDEVVIHDAYEQVEKLIKNFQDLRKSVSSSKALATQLENAVAKLYEEEL